MFKLDLFLGFKISSEVDKALVTANAYLLKTFVDSQPEYLQQIEINQENYLGKKIPSTIDFNALLLLEQNVISLSKKVLQHSLKKIPPLQLITLCKLND